jgi:hypothetical protein
MKASFLTSQSMLTPSSFSLQGFIPISVDIICYSSTMTKKKGLASQSAELQKN